MNCNGLVSLFLLLATATSTTAQNALQNFPGKWIATGQLSTEPDAPMEHGRCRVRAEQDANANSFTIRGRCAVAAGSGSMILTFVDSGNGRVRAGFTSPAIDGVAQLAGTRADRTIRLTTRTPYSFNGEFFDVRSTITFLNDDQFTVRDWNAAAGTNQWRLVTDLSFTRQLGVE